jgi:hypothetical protein
METLQRTANRGSISTGFDIDNSLKLEADNTEYLHFTPSSQTDYERLAFSIWVTRTEIRTTQTIAEFGNGTSDTTQLRIGFDDSDRLFCYGNSTIWRQTNQIFADTGAWYHLFFLFDTTTPGGVSNNRIRIWVNGNMIAHTDFGVINNPGSGSSMGFNRTTQQSIGTQDEDGPKNYLNGYIAQAWASGGTPPVVTDFGEFDSDTGIWKPIDISGVSIPDANGFFLDFSDSSDLGNDSSSNNNDFTLNNLTSADQATDVPTNNFCTLNPLIHTSNKPTISDGAMKVVGGGGNWNNAYGSLGVQNGKWYYEYKVNNGDIGGTGWSTFPDSSDDASSTQFLYDQSAVIQGSPTNYYQRINGTQISNESAGWGTTSLNDIIGCFLNADDQEITFARNGTVLSNTLSAPVSLNSAFSGHFIFPCNVQYENDGGLYNFGGFTLITDTKSYNDANGHGNFVYSPVLSSVNYYAICTKNIAEFG